MRTLKTKVAGIGLAAAGLVALTGCGGATESFIENQTGTEIETSEDGFKITDDEGNSSQVGGDVEVPEAWPSDVPLYDGKLMSAISAGSGFMLIWATDASVSEAYDTYKADLQSAGFKAMGSGAFGGDEQAMRTGNFENDKHTVMVVATDSGDGTKLSVTTAAKS